MDDVDKKRFYISILQGEEIYKKIGKVRCPYFSDDVVFNAKGLEHLKFKEKNHARPLEDQSLRFRLLKFAPQVLEKTHTVQGVSEQKVFEWMRSNQRNERKLVEAMFYEFVAVLNNTRVRVVVKQVGGGPKYFWSIIPFWKVNKQNGQRKLHYGCPESD